MFDLQGRRDNGECGKEECFLFLLILRMEMVQVEGEKNACCYWFGLVRLWIFDSSRLNFHSGLGFLDRTCICGSKILGHIASFAPVRLGFCLMGQLQGLNWRNEVSVFHKREI